MQLCRFVLHDEPETPRSGIFHENRIYETDGQRAIGVHDLSRIALLPPIQLAPSFRAFDHQGNMLYRNPSHLVGPLSEIEVKGDAFALEVRVLAVIKDEAESIEASEADEFILGYAAMIGVYMDDLADEERRAGRPPVRAFDLPFAMGPFLVIPEAKPEDLFKPAFTAKVNGQPLDEPFSIQPDFAGLLEISSEFSPLKAGDLIAAPPAPLPSLVSGPLGRFLQPGDTLQFGNEALGLLTVKLT